MSDQDRARNLQTVLDFFAPETRAPGGAKLRAGLFSEDGVKQVCYPIDPDHTRSAPELPARELLSAQPDYNCGLDLDCVVWAAEDPCVFRAETVERGELELCGEKGPFRGHCLHTFTVRGGLIRSWRAFPNTFTVYPALGLEPADATAALPADATAALPADAKPMELPPELARELAENGRRVGEELLPMLALRDVEPVRAGGGSVRILAYGTFDPADEALREKNRRAVKLYFDRAGREALGISRDDLFTQDGITEVPMDHMAPLNPGHHAFTTRPGPNTTAADPFWRTEIVRFDATARPDTFWVETRSYHAPGAPEKPLEGMPTYTAAAYWNHYNFFFQAREGKLCYCREFLDPRSERRVMGVRETPLPAGALDVYRYL